LFLYKSICKDYHFVFFLNSEKELEGKKLENKNSLKDSPEYIDAEIYESKDKAFLEKI